MIFYHRKRSVFLLLILTISIFFCGLFVKSNVSAMSGADIYKQLLANNMVLCYSQSDMAKSINLAEYKSFKDSVLNGSGGKTNVFYVPTGVNNTLPVETEGTLLRPMGCDGIFLDGSAGAGKKAGGMFTTFGKNEPRSSDGNLKDELVNLGYTDVKETKTKLLCVTATYSKSFRVGATKNDVGSICWDETQVTNGDFASLINSAQVVSDQMSIGSDGYSAVLTFRLNEKLVDEDGDVYAPDSSCDVTVPFSTNTSLRDLVNNLSNKMCSISAGTNSSKSFSFNVSSTEKDGATNATTTVSIPGAYATAYEVSRQYFTGSANIYNFSKQDKLSLYDLYLDNIYGAQYENGECLTRSQLESSGGPVQGGPTYYRFRGGKYCPISVDSASVDKNVAVFADNNSTRLTEACGNVECLLRKIFALGLGDDDADADAGGGTGQISCDDLLEENGKSIGAMQWLLCPTMDNTAETADWLDRITQDLLEMKSTMYSNSDLSEAWGGVRNIANVLITLFLLVVVFSQLTGYGIDNYGIKKMLPRIIMMAIIVNLSLYICQIAVDLSNIFGTGLQTLFTTPNATDPPSVITAILGIFTTAGGAVAGTTATVALAAGGWVALIVGIVLFVLVIIVAIAVLYLMVAARQIIIIFCILISPLAFATFILPNTQHLFKKWWELFKAALIIFPICGAVSGVSKSLRGMDLGDDAGIAMKLILLVLPFLVFFLLPTLLKQAIAAFGKIGGALSSMGQSIRNSGRQIGGAAMRGAQNSEVWKNRQLDVARRRQSDSSQRTIDSLKALKKQREANGKKLTDAETRRLARAHETQRKLGLEDQAARTILAEKDYAGMSQKQIMDKWDDAFDSGNTEEMDALTNVITSKYGPGGASSIAERLANKQIFDANGNFVVKPNGDKTMERSFNALQANMVQNKALATNMQNKAADAYQMISSGGFGGDNNTRHNLGWHSANNDMATQTKDWATQSSASLRRAAANGGLTQKMAQQILNSNDPTVQSGILSDASKRAVVEAVASGNYTGDYSKQDMKQVAGGMDTAYVNRSAESVADEAWAENARRNGRGDAGGNAGPGPSVDVNIDHSGDGVDEIPE